MSEVEILDFLRTRFNRVDERLDKISTAVLEIKQRLGFLEGQYGSLSRRVDELDFRLDRIERRLDIVNEPIS